MTTWKSNLVINGSPVVRLDALDLTVSCFEAITLEEMDSVKLMDRFDTKFVFRAEQLPLLLQMASQRYRVLQIGEERFFHYSSTYFDSADLAMYHDHHNQKLNRFKVRKREYLNSGQVFFEVKYKSNKGITRKKRISTENRNKAFTKAEKKFLKKVTPYRAKNLYDVLNNNFHRITLVHRQNPERVTIDLNLSYEYRGNSSFVPHLAIAEIKQGRSSGISDLEKIFRQNFILPLNFSKYCMGMVIMNPEIKYNRFKNKFLALKKLSNNGYASTNF
jgi:hypothetical protein